jgi:hypothetical protein
MFVVFMPPCIYFVLVYCFRFVVRIESVRIRLYLRSKLKLERNFKIMVFHLLGLNLNHFDFEKPSGQFLGLIVMSH